VSITKNFNNNNWYVYDDEKITFISEEDMEKVCKTTKAYVVAYKQH
jgi:ubiquitin C-terminal hydrolase